MIKISQKYFAEKIVYLRNSFASIIFINFNKNLIADRWKLNYFNNSQTK